MKDWKAYYAAEWNDPDRVRMVDELSARDEADPDLDHRLARGDVLSVPHTHLAASAPSLVRAARAILRAGARRLVAIGVHHGGAAPAPHDRPLAAYRRDLLRAGADSAALRETYERYPGPYVVPACRTRFGPLPAWTGELPPGAQADAAILAREFSLDNLLHVVARLAQRRGAPPPETLAIYPGLTVAPDGAAERGAELGRRLRRIAGPGAVVVASGDLAHFGAFYGGETSLAGMPEDLPRLSAHLRARIDAMLHAAFVSGDGIAAARIGAQELRSDQIFVAPVLSAYLGSPAAVDVLECSLTDYASILETPPPCLVGSVFYAVAPRP